MPVPAGMQGLAMCSIRVRFASMRCLQKRSCARPRFFGCVSVRMRVCVCVPMQAGVPLLDPRTRCFSELPQWLESHAPQLKDKRVLMYCTGGVRCERASAFLTEMGVRDVYQLQGESCSVFSANTASPVHAI